MIVTAVKGVPVISVAEFPDLTSGALEAMLRQTDNAGQTTGSRLDYDHQQTGRDIDLSTGARKCRARRGRHHN
ncbi:MAG: hypothetical protein ACLPPF_00555 [Rhodomicrobium sp.]